MVSWDTMANRGQRVYCFVLSAQVLTTSFMRKQLQITMKQLSIVLWSEMAKWFAICVDQTTDLCSEPIWPKYQCRLVRSLYMFGAATHSSGIKLRPALPGQHVFFLSLLTMWKVFINNLCLYVLQFPLMWSNGNWLEAGMIEARGLIVVHLR